MRVFDFGYGGFIRFDSDGGYLGSVPIDPEAMIFPNGALLSHPDGGVLSAGGGRSMRMGPNGPEFPKTRPVQLFTLADEIEVGSVYEGWNPATADGDPSMRTSGGGGIQIQAPPQRAFDPELLFGLTSDGRVAVADSTTYRIKIMNLEGTVEQVVQRPFTPRPVTETDRHAEKERQLEEMTSSEGPRMMMRTDDGATMSISRDQVQALFESRIEGMVFASEMPLISGMAVDWNDHIWVKRHGSAVGEEGPLDVLTLEGEYLGTLAPGEGRIPDAFGPDGLAAFIETDELDVPRVEVRRLAIR